MTADPTTAPELSGSRAVVTGGGRGIGRGIALALAGAGADVVVHYGRSADAASRTVADIETMGRRAIAMPAEITDTAAVSTMIDTAAEWLGGLDVVVANAGTKVARCRIEDMDDELYQRVVEVNLGATVRTVRAAVPHLRRGGGGRIVTMSSLAAHNGGGPGAALYAAVKAAIVGLTKGLAKELGDDGITVNAVAPGFIGGTAFHATYTSEEGQRAAVAATAVGRAGTVDDVAAAVRYLVSPAAAFVTGTTIDIDGGVALR